MVLNVLKLIKVLSDFDNIICGVLQCSVLGHLIIFIFYLHLSVILMYHTIGYHVYADDTQLYIYHLNVNSHWRFRI